MKKTVILIFFRKLLTLGLWVAGVYAEDCKVCEIYKRMLQHNPDDSYQLLNLNIDGDIVDTLEEDHSEGLVTFTK